MFSTIAVDYFSPKIRIYYKKLLKIIITANYANYAYCYNFCFYYSTFADKITKFSSNTQKYLHISQKSSTFALAFAIFRFDSVASLLPP